MLAVVPPLAPDASKTRKRPAAAAVSEPTLGASSTRPKPGPPPLAMPSNIGEYAVEAKLGEGTYGSVYRAIAPDGCTVVAIKRMKAVRDGISHTAYREISLVRELRHPQIVRMLDVLIERDEAGARALNLVFEHIDGDLSQRIRASRSTGLEPRVVRLLMRQLLEGLAYLHRCTVMHRDIKPANLLVTADWRLKIGDFGLARLYDQPLRALHLDGPVVTVWYRAPELLLGAASHTPAVDCWAAGCIFGELLCCKVLFTAAEAKGDVLQQGQLRAIFGTLGMPTEPAWPGLGALKHWPLVSTWPAAEFGDVLDARMRAGCAPAATPSAPMLRMLRGLLSYAPEHRLTAGDALAGGWLAEPEPAAAAAGDGAGAAGGEAEPRA